MGLILCESLEVKNPFHIDVLPLDIYSFEELCYVIFENPILVTEGIVSDALVDFIGKDLKLPDLAEFLEMSLEKSRKWQFGKLESRELTICFI